MSQILLLICNVWLLLLSHTQLCCSVLKHRQK
uniref:Uncharacterized protein n=1 Tax=Anguilla anguilla TaxID=7936 RepID=A0A0E9V0N2_ANGAN